MDPCNSIVLIARDAIQDEVDCLLQCCQFRSVDDIVGDMCVQCSME